MKKYIFLSFLLAVLLTIGYVQFEFSQDSIWHIDLLRREHSNFLFGASRIIHNKLSYYLSHSLEVYLFYLSPKTLFSQSGSFFIDLLIFSLFLISLPKIKKKLLIWTFFYPVILAIFGVSPTFVLTLPILLPFILIGLRNVVVTIRR